MGCAWRSRRACAPKPRSLAGPGRGVCLAGRVVRAAGSGGRLRHPRRRPIRAKLEAMSNRLQQRGRRLPGSRPKNTASIPLHCQNPRFHKPGSRSTGQALGKRFAPRPTLARVGPPESGLRNRVSRRRRRLPGRKRRRLQRRKWGMVLVSLHPKGPLPQGERAKGYGLRGGPLDAEKPRGIEASAIPCRCTGSDKVAGCAAVE